MTASCRCDSFCTRHAVSGQPSHCTHQVHVLNLCHDSCRWCMGTASTYTCPLPHVRCAGSPEGCTAPHLQKHC